MDATTVIGTAASATVVGGVIVGIARFILKNHTESLIKEYLSEIK